MKYKFTIDSKEYDRVVFSSTIKYAAFMADINYSNAVSDLLDYGTVTIRDMVFAIEVIR